jgi:hypothetical protein
MEVPMHRQRKLSLVVFALLGVMFAADAYAIIGMPLTPMSYAGVARRTVRRAYY